MHLGLSPLEERAKQLYNNVYALMFIDYCYKEEETNRLKALGKLIGAFWDRETVEVLFGSPTTKATGGASKPLNEVTIPIAVWQSPEIGKYLKKLFKIGSSAYSVDTPSWAQKDEIIDGFSLDRKKFEEIASMFTGIATSLKNKL